MVRIIKNIKTKPAQNARTVTIMKVLNWYFQCDSSHEFVVYFLEITPKIAAKSNGFPHWVGKATPTIRVRHCSA